MNTSGGQHAMESSNATRLQALLTHCLQRGTLDTLSLPKNVGQLLDTVTLEEVRNNSPGLVLCDDLLGSLQVRSARVGSRIGAGRIANIKGMLRWAWRTARARIEFPCTNLEAFSRALAWTGTIR